MPRRGSELHAIALLILLFFARTSAEAIEIIATPQDGRLRVDEQVGVFWLNEDEILYRGFREKEIQQIEQHTFSGVDLYRTPRVLRKYNIRSKRIEDIAETGHGALCYSGGKVFYEKPGNQWPPLSLYGVLGKEPPYDSTLPLDFTRCNSPDTSHLPVKWPSEVVPLLEEHGFIEIRIKDPGRVQAGDEPDLFLYEPGATTGKAIQGFTARSAQNLRWKRPIYAPWKAAYFIYTVGVANLVPNSGWWLYPDGRTERVDVPIGRWNDADRTSAGFGPTRCGLLVDNRASPTRELLFLRQAGIAYLEPQRIPVPTYWQLSVSPDGRTVAIAAGAVKIPNTNPSMLHVVRLCHA